jgi:hypothetical protein
MTRQQSTVIWLGLILVTLNLIVNIAEVKAVIFGGSAAKPAGKPAAGNNAAAVPQPNPAPNPTPASQVV